MTMMMMKMMQMILEVVDYEVLHGVAMHVAGGGGG